MCSPPVRRSRTRITVVSAVTTSSTNMTGFFISVRGSSLTKAEPIAGKTILGSNSADTGMRLRISEVSMEVVPDQFEENTVPAIIASCSTIGPSASAGKKVRPPMMRITPTTRPMNSPPVGREGACGGRHRFLRDQRAGDRHRRNDHPEAADQHRKAASRIVEDRVAGSPANAEPLLPVCDV